MRKGRFRNSGPPQFTICLNFPANPAGGPSGKSQAGMEIAMPCRGGYDPPVRLCNRRLRGARRLGAPSVGATCGRPLIEDAPLAERAAFLEVASLDFYRKRPRRLRLGRGPAFFPKESGGKERAGGLPPAPPKKRGLMAAVGCTDRAKTNRALPPASSAQVSDHSLRRKRQSSLPLCPCSRRGRAITGPKRPANRAAPFFRLSSSATGGASPENSSPHRTRFAGLRRGPQLLQAPMGRAAMPTRFLQAPYSPPPP